MDDDDAAQAGAIDDPTGADDAPPRFATEAEQAAWSFGGAVKAAAGLVKKAGNMWDKAKGAAKNFANGVVGKTRAALDRAKQMVQSAAKGLKLPSLSGMMGKLKAAAERARNALRSVPVKLADPSQFKVFPPLPRIMRAFTQQDAVPRTFDPPGTTAFIHSAPLLFDVRVCMCLTTKRASGMELNPPDTCKDAMSSCCELCPDTWDSELPAAEFQRRLRLYMAQKMLDAHEADQRERAKMRVGGVVEAPTERMPNTGDRNYQQSAQVPKPLDARDFAGLPASKLMPGDTGWDTGVALHSDRAKINQVQYAPNVPPHVLGSLWPVGSAGTQKN